MRGLISGVALWCTLAFASCIHADQPERMQLMLGGQLFDLELVNDPDSRRQGLMGRETLAADSGMLFDFPEGTRPAIWMRNMLISLDLLYVDAEGVVRQLFIEVPPCLKMPCPVYQAQQPLRFVLELPAGSISRLGIGVGDRLALGPLLQQAPPAY